VTYRELFNTIMHYGEFDRVPVIHWGCWTETRERWLQEGLPADIDEHEYFDASIIASYQVCCDTGLFPAIENEILEETADYKIYKNTEGVILQEWKNKSSVPHYIDYTLKDAKAWPEFKKRLQPDPGRIPADLDERIKRAEALDIPITVNTGSMIGWLRNWMGVENLAYLAYDDRDVLFDMVNTLSDLVCWQLDIILPKIKVDMGWCWEDICFRTGPLISPDIFKECAVPGYRKISDKLLAYGVDLHLVDCDGYIEDLVPHWMDGGVNVMLPLEIGVWNADPMEFRKKYGKELRIMGGINKMEIAKGPAATRAEIERRLPLMKQGGYIPHTDHLAVPETSLEDYKYYIEQMKAIRF
jgi:hypothetical protein